MARVSKSSGASEFRVFGGVGGKERVWAWVAQLVERVLGKDEVTGSIPVPGSSSGEWEREFGKGRAGVTQR